MGTKTRRGIVSRVLGGIIRGGAGEASRLELPSLILLALSMGDIYVTFRLLTTGQGYYESNPVAEWFLAHWNFKGMFLFKLGMVAVTITLGEIIERHRPGLGRLVLWLGCIVSTVVVWHGLRLYLGLPGLPFWSPG
ncbi:MAG: DUF5658 family protein [Isosphaeraceae bacterium]